MSKRDFDDERPFVYAFFGLAGLTILFQIALIVGLVWVAVHFLGKVW